MRSPFVEKEVDDIEGILEIRAAVSLQDYEVMQYLLQKDDGTIYYLNFSDFIPDGLRTGDKIHIEKGFLRISDDYEQLVILSKDLVVINKNLEEPDAFGAQNTIVMLVNFFTQPDNRPYTYDEVYATIFDESNNHFKESSYQQTSIVGKVVGWFTLPISSYPCRNVETKLPRLADEAAIAAGVDLNLYMRKVYIFPLTTCQWNRLGTIGRSSGNASKSWINGDKYFRNIAIHEFGHNLTLRHASTTDDIYGDNTDTMGRGNGTHFNSYSKEKLGWLGYGNSPPIQTITTSGFYTIYPYELNNRNIKALKILKRADAGSDNDLPEYYYLEYRQPIGFDAPLGCTWCDYTKGVVLHTGIQTDYKYATYKTYFIKTILPGEKFTDESASNGGIAISVVSVTPRQAKVMITFGSNTPSPPDGKRIPL